MVILANETNTRFIKPIDFYRDYQTKRIDPDDDTQKAINIACGIIQQAVEDWQYLQYGQIEDARYLTQKIRYDELINFFRSPWFEFLLSYALPDYTIEDILTALKVKH